MALVSTLPKRLQPMLATLTDAPFDDKGWIFEDKYDGFRMVARVDGGKVTLYSRNGKIISHSYIEVAQALEGVKGDAVIDGELVAIGEDGASHFQLLQNALRHEAKLQYFVFDLMFQEGEDLRRRPLTERRKRLKAILPKHKLIGFSRDRKTFGVKFFEEAERKGLEGIMAKRADSKYLSGARTDDWLKIKTSKRQEVVIAGFTAPRRTRPCFGALTLALREGNGWRYIGHVGTGFSHETRRAAQKAHHAQSRQISFRQKSEGRSGHHLGEAATRCRGESYRVDELRRNAAPRLSRPEKRQAGKRRRHGTREATRMTRHVSPVDRRAPWSR
ncbi:bifunctional non-homologous end joining protein LigD [Bradyrhizobium japonicum]|uniref:DNA ligase (ATP) n=1 Tax=Bradyrhizobium japonicum TaxID=375 RepID=A0ABV2RW35_BRAJP